MSPLTTGLPYKLLLEIGKNLEKAKSSIREAQADMLRQFDKKRAPPPPLAVGSSVWVNGEGIAWPADSKRPNALQAPWLGPFTVAAPRDERDNVVVELPPSLSQTDPRFHISKMEPFVSNDPVEFPGRTQESPPPVVADSGGYVAELESILDMRWSRGKIQVLCKYLGYPSSEAEWLDYSPFDPSWDDDRALVVQYQQTHPPLAPPVKKISKRVQAARTRLSAPIQSPMEPVGDSTTSLLSNVALSGVMPRRSSRRQT